MFHKLEAVFDTSAVNPFLSHWMPFLYNKLTVHLGSLVLVLGGFTNIQCYFYVASSCFVLCSLLVAVSREV